MHVAHVIPLPHLAARAESGFPVAAWRWTRPWAGASQGAGLLRCVHTYRKSNTMHAHACLCRRTFGLACMDGTHVVAWLQQAAATRRATRPSMTLQRSSHTMTGRPSALHVVVPGCCGAVPRQRAGSLCTPHHTCTHHQHIVNSCMAQAHLTLCSNMRPLCLLHRFVRVHAAHTLAPLHPPPPSPLFPSLESWHGCRPPG